MTKYVIKQYDKNGYLIERYDGYDNVESAEKDIKWFKRVDMIVDGNKNGEYFYEIEEEE